MLKHNSGHAKADHHSLHQHHHHLPAEHSVSHVYDPERYKPVVTKKSSGMQHFRATSRNATSHVQNLTSASAVNSHFSKTQSLLIWKQWIVNDKFSYSLFQDDYSRSILDKTRSTAKGVFHHLSLLNDGYIALFCAGNKLTIASQHPVNSEIEIASTAAITFATVIVLNSTVYVVVGDSKGGVHVYQHNDTEGTNKLVASHTTSSNHPIKSILHQSTSVLHRSVDGILYLWVVNGESLSLIGCKLSNNNSASHSSSPVTTSTARSSVIKLTQYMSFSVAESELGVFHRPEILDTSYGPSTCLAVHGLKSMTGKGSFASVCTINCRLVLHYAEKFRRNQMPLPNNPLSLGSAFLFPYVTHNSTSKKSNTGMFSFVSTPTAADNAGFEYATLVQESIHSVAVVDYSNLQTAITRSVFSYDIQLVGSNGNKVVGSVITSQEAVCRHICTLGEKAFSQPETTIDCALTVEYSLTDTHGGHHEARSTDPDPEILQRPVLTESDKKLTNITLWRACLQLELVSPARFTMLREMVCNHDDKYASESRAQGSSYDSTAEKFQEKVLGRLIVMECALVCGLSAVLAEYIESHGSHQNGYDIQYLLTDVKRVHEWAVPTATPYTVGLPNVQSHVEALSRDLTLNHIVPLLLSRQSQHPGATMSPADVSRDLPVTVNMELQTHITMCRSVKVVIESLIRRKMMSVVGDRQVSSSDIMYGVVEEAITELRVRLTEINCILGVLEMLHVLCTHPDMSFNCLLSSAGGQSLRSTARDDRLLISDDLKHVPEALHGGLLFDELRKLLDEKLIPQTELSATQNMTVLSKSITTFLFLPLATLKNATPGAMSSMTEGASAEDVDTQLNQAMQVGQAVVLHFLLDAYLLFQDPNCDETPLTAFGTALGSAADMPSTLTMGVIALFKIDASYCVYEAMLDICDPTVTSILQDDTMLLAVLKRAICSNHLDDARKLTNHLMVTKHALMSTQIGVLCHAVCLTHNYSWQSLWNECRKLCLSMPDQQIALDTKQQIVHIVARWAMRSGELSHFLTAPMDNLEVRSVIDCLREMAQKEITRCAVQSPCVDLCISFLLKKDLYTEALKVHEEHVRAIHSQPISVVNSASAALNTRKTMLDAYHALPRVTGLNIGNVTGVVNNGVIQAYQQRTQVTRSAPPPSMFDYTYYNTQQTPYTQRKAQQQHYTASSAMNVDDASPWRVERVEQISGGGLGAAKRIRFERQ